MVGFVLKVHGGTWPPLSLLGLVVPVTVAVLGQYVVLLGFSSQDGTKLQLHRVQMPVGLFVSSFSGAMPLVQSLVRSLLVFRPT